MSRGRNLALALVALLLAGVTAAVYGRVGTFGFVGLDDPRYLTENGAVLEGLSAAGLRWAWSAGHASNWHPLTWLSHMLDVELFGVDPGPHHLVSLALHVLNALLLLGVLRRLTGALWPSALVAALFALHPLHVESVAWIAERKDVLAGTFWVLTIQAYSAWVARGGVGRYALTVLCLAAGLASKPTLVTLPFVLLLLDWWPLGRVRGGPPPAVRRDGVAAVPVGRLVLEKLPLLALSLASSVVTYLVQQAGGTLSAAGPVPLVARISNATAAYGAYLVKTLWPLDLSFFYPLEKGWDAGWGAATVLGSAALLVGVTWLSARERRRRPWVVVGWLLYLGTLVPMIGLVQAGWQAMADRYGYLSLTGVFVMVAWGLADLARAIPRLRPVLTLLAAVGLAACTSLTWRQVGYWKDSETLARHALELDQECWMAHLMLGQELAARGEKQAAIRHFDEALRLEPYLPIAEYGLGNALRDLGQLPLAIRHYEEALRLHPEYASAAYNLAGVYYELGEVEAATRWYRETTRLWPELAEAHNNLGNCLVRQGRLEDARGEYEEALRLDPELAAARENLEELFGGRSGKEPEGENRLGSGAEDDSP